MDYLPSRGQNLSRVSLHSRALSRRGVSRKLSNFDSNVVTVPKTDVEEAMEMMGLEDSADDPLAESRNIEKIKSMPVPLAQRKSVKYGCLFYSSSSFTLRVCIYRNIYKSNTFITYRLSKR